MKILMLYNRRVSNDGHETLQLKVGETYTVGEEITHTVACEMLKEMSAIKTIMQEKVYA